MPKLRRRVTSRAKSQPPLTLQYLATKIDDLAAAVAQGFNGMMAEFSEMKGDVSTLKSDVSTLKTDVRVLKSDVSILKTDVKVLKDDVFELKGRMGRVEQGLTDLRDEVRTNHETYRARFKEQDRMLRRR